MVPQVLRRFFLSVAVLSLVTGAAWGQGGSWLGPDGEPLPFTTHEEVLEFLREAKVVLSEVLDEGVTTGKREMVLERDGVRARAVFRTFQKEQRNIRTGTGQTIRYFVDSYENEMPAYELSRMLGYLRIHPVLERRIKGKKGSLQLWVEDAMSEKDRRAKGLSPPDPERWNLEEQNMIVFDNLINNIDRNQGNILIDKGWEISLIDHGRTFSRDWHLPKKVEMERCGRALWQAVQALTEEETRRRLGAYLDGPELTALFKRQEQVVDILRERIKSEGEEKVIF